MAYRIGVLTSTTRRERAGEKIAKWFIEQANKIESELTFELVDIIDLPLLDEANLPSQRKYEDESSKNWSKVVSGFDGFVIVLAEYNHTPPAPIKNALDTLFHEWSRKVVGFVGYGSYGAESSIMGLRPLISYLNMMPIRESVRITKAHEALDQNGQPKTDYVLGDINKFVGELGWWAKALTDARS
ncbi:MAG TPA: NAD(P)H-dependent oxidoreductase [Candidatus Saccharimonadales bacterium]